MAGTDDDAPEVPAEAAHTPRQALEACVLAALAQPPCVVSFSGGRDSSLVLAVATHVARREGLPPPIPFTLRFFNAPETEEPEWQERVVRHLDLADWIVRTLDDELDCVGPVAQRVMRRHGLLWPLNSHFVQPAAQAASGGTLLTGSGGDQVLAPSPHVHVPSAGGPRVRDLARWGFRAAPQSVRRAVVARRNPEPLSLPWLREQARRDVYRAMHDDDAAEPRLAAERTRWVWRLRAIQVALRCLSAVVEDEGARLVDPMLDRHFVAALAADARSGAYATRTIAMRTLAGDLLPDDVCARTTKAVFQRPFWNRHSEDFARRFDGACLDEALVDVDALKRHWADPAGPTAQSMTVLQAAWLATDARSASGQSTGQRVDDTRG